MSGFIFKPVDESFHFAWIYNNFKDAITFENILEYLIFKFFNKVSLFQKSHANISLFLVQIYFTIALLLLFHSFCLF